ANPRGASEVLSLRRDAERRIVVEVGLIGREVVGWLLKVEVEGTLCFRSGPSSTSVFPLRLTRQAVQIATPRLFFIQLLQKLLHVVPRHRLDREELELLVGKAGATSLIRSPARERTGVVAHDRLPLALRHRVDRDLEVPLDLRFRTRLA